ncbi:alpha-hydroxy-acid oxidizing protein [Roseomonas alkaliterrae]|jgi:L-lactate dehydrogenase (cytochrome)|uniref:L-lactate dehydrogenase (Cytochrome) n=1 Tax=Neoroseomonas alkaliterrae TaxID=1452450 RepID=A0A840Y1J6_9PROT|nr:alpha-hydroxy acid oxidase [Neoroseomonas alkaliterrae]MBB5689891.1 L-lactate dehydrogenase (cytochrome) [Neoroseomonas alkaliterrae]MBR0675056.1 alpha-hydroxy-acid oxidizing protein [Neoroseomonas alkaliterrae]
MTAEGPAQSRAPVNPGTLSQKRAAPPVPPNLRGFLSLQDFEKAAARHLPRMLHGYLAGGVETDWSLADNRRAFAEWGFIPRVLVDARARTTAASLFGRDYAAPFGIPPMGSSALLAYRGDIVLAQAARAKNIPFIMSASSLIRLEEIAKANPDAWYQAYLPGEPARIEPLVDRVIAAGFKTFVLTVDVQVSSNRENNIRNGYTIPLKPTFRLFWQGATHPRWAFGTWFRTLRNHGMPHFENMDAGRGPPILSRDLERAFGARDGLSWPHLELIRRRFPGKLLIKGVLHPDDVVRAKEIGVDGFMVSNHGGRQLDGAVSGLRMLPEIVKVAGGLPVIYDGGVRRGTDVMKAYCLGASFVFVGRPMLCAAAVRGQPGVERAIDLLQEEIHRDLALIGANSMQELGPEFLMRVG